MIWIHRQNSSNLDYLKVEQKPGQEARFINRVEVEKVTSELEQKMRDFVNRLIRRDERLPKIITYKDKPGKYTAQDIIEYLDNIPYVLDYPFLDLEHPYFYTANSRMTLFADETRWAIIFEKSGYTPRGFRVELHLYYLGNCLENLKPIPNSDMFYNTEYPILIDGNELKKTGELKLRSQYVKLPDTKDGYVKWVPYIMTREFPKEIEYQDIARYLAYESSKFIPLPTEEEKTNPRRVGQALAAWVREKLMAQGREISEEPITEGWRSFGRPAIRR
jgi:hypothetical protein